MIGLVVVCHQDMGAELVKAAEMIVGKIEAVATVSVKQDSAPEMLRDEIQAAIKKVDRKKGVMLFTDMFGGTPSNIALAFLGDAVEVVTGVNLSMLIKFANHRDEKSLPDLAKLVQEAAQKSVVIASQMLKGKEIAAWLLFIRIDDRLIHGQVVEGWVNFLKASSIFVADDQVATNTPAAFDHGNIRSPRASRSPSAMWRRSAIRCGHRRQSRTGPSCCSRSRHPYSGDRDWVCPAAR